MTIRRALTASALLLLGAAVLAGCATTPGGATPPDAAPPADGQPSEAARVAAGWLDGGRSIGLVTYGSSSCRPTAEDVTASGQTVTVTLTDGVEGAACTRDLVPRGTLVPLPDGVDASQDVDIVVAGSSVTGETTVSALAGAVDPGAEDSAAESSAGWFDADGGLLVLTWGSSSCYPEFSTVELTSAGEVHAVVADPPADRVCTADYAAQVNVLQVPDVADPLPGELVLSFPGAEDTRIPILS